MSESHIPKLPCGWGVDLWSICDLWDLIGKSARRRRELWLWERFFALINERETCLCRSPLPIPTLNIALWGLRIWSWHITLGPQVDDQERRPRESQRKQRGLPYPWDPHRLWSPIVQATFLLVFGYLQPEHNWYCFGKRWMASWQNHLLLIPRCPF